MKSKKSKSSRTSPRGFLAKGLMPDKERLCDLTELEPWRGRRPLSAIRKRKMHRFSTMHYWSGLRVRSHKTVDDCFWRRKSTKQEAHEGLNARQRAPMRLDSTRTLAGKMPLIRNLKKKNAPFFNDALLERITGLEPATSTLARWRSTK